MLLLVLMLVEQQISIWIFILGIAVVRGVRLSIK